MFLGVALGAFAAHALKSKLAVELFNVFEVGVRYQIYHALGLLLIGCISLIRPATRVNTTGWLFLTGTLLFSGSLFIYSLSGVRWLVFITPIGGMMFLAGWAFLFLSASR
jgi:uncharacterized membrane protein YgdD (TMEM256/DUF423 family)